MQIDTGALEHVIEEVVDVNTAIEVDGDTLVVTGIIDSAEERQAILDVLGELEPSVRVIDNLAYGGVMPAEIGDYELSEAQTGGFATTSDEPEEIPVSEVVPGFADSALEEAVLNELRRDASTAGLLVQVESLQGVVTLRGYVVDVEDSENAQAVASRIPGVVEVRDELTLWVRQPGREA